MDSIQRPVVSGFPECPRAASGPNARFLASLLGATVLVLLLLVPIEPVHSNDTPLVDQSPEELAETIRNLRKKLADRELLIEKLEQADTFDRPVHPTVRRLRATVSELRQTIGNQEKQLRQFKQKDLSELKEAREQARKRKDRLNELQSELQDVKQAKTTRKSGEMTVTLDDTILFDLGTARLKDSAKPTLRSLSDIIADYDNYRVLVQGHTDDLPVSSNRFESNWGLSAQRAVNVVEYLQEHSSLPGDRLLAAGYGPYHPVAPNTSEENRARNRRVEIKLVPVEALKSEDTLRSDTATGPTASS